MVISRQISEIMLRVVAIVIAITAAFPIPAREKIRNYSTADGMSHDRVQGIFEDSKGMIWVCTWYGIDRFDGYDFVSFRPHREFEADCRFKEAFALNDTLIIKTRNGHKLVFDMLELRFDGYTDSIPRYARRLRRRLTDRFGNTWASAQEGMTLTANPHSDFSYVVNADYPFARAIYEDSEGRIWVSWCREPGRNNTAGEVIIYDVEGHTLSVPLNDYAVYSIMEDDMKNIWLGTRDKGLIILTRNGDGRYRPIHYQTDDKSGSLSHNAIFDIVRDSHGRVWIATLGGGLNMVERGYDIARLSFSVPAGFPTEEYPRVRSVLEHAEILYVGTDTGMLRSRGVLSDANLTFVPVKSGASRPAEEIIHLTDWTSDAFLVSSFGKGIYGYDSGKDIFFPVAADSIAGRQPVFAAVPVGQDNLWVTTQTGILLYDLKKYNTYITPLGIKLKMLETQPLRDRHGQLWFATADGVVRVNDSLVAAVDLPTKVYFSDITFLKRDSVKTKILSHADTVITLTPDIRDVSLHVSSLRYGMLDGVKYFWRINEQDTTWTPVDGQNSILLTGLTPGEKTVEVCSTDSYGRMMDNIGKIRLTVTPHWYESRYFRIAVWTICIMVLSLMLYLFISNRRLRRIYESVINSQPVAIVSAAMTEIKPEESLTQSDRDFISALNDKIDGMIGTSDFSIDSIVSAMGMSRSVFYRRLKTIVGQSPSEYINKYRLTRAAGMLRENPDRPVSTIAYDCGFSSPQYFSNLFRKEYHMTPNEWRKNV